MTLERLKAWGAAARPWLLYAALIVLCLLWARSCNRGARSAEEVGRLREEVAARAADVPVVEPVPDVRPALEAALASNRELAAELERARRAVPGARPVGVASAAAAPAPVAAAPRPGEPADPPTCGSGAAARPALPSCLLRQGDALQLKMAEVVLEGRGGAHLLVGTLEAWRSSPGEPALLLRQPFSTSLTRAVEKAQPAAEVARWRAGPLAVVGSEGWRLGALLATPQARVPLLGWHVEALAGVAVGPPGAQGQVAVLIQP